MAESPVTLQSIVKSMGLVFGDIGTSPIYTLTAIFLLIPATKENILGILSLIVWTLIVVVTLEYTYLAMHLSKKGEGGTIVLKEILLPLVKSGNQAAFISLLAIIGISLFIGDGVITPAISILSAVEGIRLVPGYGGIAQTSIILIAAIIAILLFWFQAKGSERVAWAFGPVMAVWFTVIAFAGAIALTAVPDMLFAFNPLYAAGYFLRNGIAGFFILSSVILCATGGEALFADMGHLGREPIIKAWYLVLGALVLCYFGQGAYLFTHPDAGNILFEMVYSESAFLYIPFLLLSIAATVIASQAMISGIFSVVYQGITTRIFPLLRVEYTSPMLRSQIYIDIVNWFLLLSVLVVMLVFQTSNNLTHAYGLAVSGTMAITGIMITWILIKRNDHIKIPVAVLTLVVNMAFLLATFNKIPEGAYWSLLFAAFPCGLILIYINGQKKLFSSLRPVPFAEFLHRLERYYPESPKIKGTALYFTRDYRALPQYIIRTIFDNGILYERNIIVSIIRTEYPFGKYWTMSRELTPGLWVFEIKLGYMEIVDIDTIFADAEIDEKTIFYGIEEILTTKPVWRIFAAIKRLCPSVVQFYKLPPDKIHGVVTRIEM